MARKLTASKDMKQEYSAQVVRIGELTPIKDSDFLAETMVGGFTMVVRKDEFKTGDYAIYCKNETMLNKDFLFANNLFELSEYDRNSNKVEVATLKREIKDLKASTDLPEDERNARIEELEVKCRSLCGFFNKHGRVKSIKLRGVQSYGFIIKLESLAKWKPEVISVDLSKDILNEEMGIGIDFDTVCDELFIKEYMPPVRRHRNHSSGNKKSDKRVEKFSRIDKKDFQFHYDTNPLNSNIWRINPDDVVTISLKEHGTSFIGANIPVKNPIKLPVWSKVVNWFVKRAEKLYLWLKQYEKATYAIDFGNVYASRTVIKNQNINPKAKDGGFYDVDVWCSINELIKPYIEKGMMIYGEVCGYLPESDKMIQKPFDYGHDAGTCSLMIYRITTTNEDGAKKEWNVQDVYDWTVKLIEEHPELKGKVRPITILYHGTLADLYPEVDKETHWHENILKELKKDKKNFKMESNEPMCKNKVPREGIVVRIDDDERAEAFKLKCEKFLALERKAVDSGKITDMEMLEAYAPTEEESNE